MKSKIDLTYSGKLTTLINVMEKKKLDVNYTIDGIVANRQQHQY